MAESSVSVVQTVLLAALRACCILFGGTAVAYVLTNQIDQTAADSRQLNGYWPWLGDALGPSAAVTEAIGNTMVLASAAILSGAILGLVIGALLRSDRVGPLLGFLAAPTIALAVPGFALYPVALAASRAGIAPIAATPIDESLGDGLRFLGLWGGLIGLSVAPAAALVFAGEAGRRRSGLAAAEALSAARPEPRASWRFGFPTTSFLLSLSAAELLSGQRGVFSLFFEALTANELATALDLTLWVVIAGSILAIAVDLVSRAVGSDVPGLASAEGPPAIRKSRLLLPLLLGAAAVAILAVVGELLGDPLAIETEERLASPAFGGPWLGRDELGRSTLTAVISSLGSTLIAGLAPGFVAGAVGLVIASALRRLSSLPRRLVAAAVDLAWWPTPMLIPLVVVAAGIPNRPELDIGVIVITGAALTPLAIRLMDRRVITATDKRLRRLLSASLSCSAIAASISLLVGFVGLGRSASVVDSAPRTNLGALMADGIAQYDLGVLPLLSAAVAATVLVALLYGVAAVLAAPDPTAVGGSGVRSWQTEPGPDEIEPTSASLSTASPPTPRPMVVEPSGEGAAVENDGPGQDDDADHSDDVDQGDEADRPTIMPRSTAPIPPEDESPLEWTATEDSPRSDAGPAAEDPIDLRSQEPEPALMPTPDTADRAIDLGDEPHLADNGDDSDDGDDGADLDSNDDEAGNHEEAGNEEEADDAMSDVMLEATKTIELRPSTLRAAGIAAPVMPDARTELSSGWSKPILASRPAPAAPSEDNNSAARSRPDDDPTEQPPDD